MDRYQMMTVYVAVAEEESFTGAARRLNISPPAVTRAVAALEDHLGVKLLQRTTRYVRTTESGKQYLDDSRRILNEIDIADAMVAGINTAPKGRLVVTAPVLFGRQYVIPGIIEYLNRYEDVEVCVMFLDRVVNLLEEGIDVGIRIGNLPDSSMRALKVGEVKMLLCASPDYLKQNGEPVQPEDLKNHSVIASRAGSNFQNWRFARNGREREVRLKVRLSVNTNDAAIEAAVKGFGITRLLSYQVAANIKAGQLKTILNDFESDILPIHIVHREDSFGATKVRVFIDLLAEQLRKNKFLN
jgi:DNA-binding transcriptional LysR family regulator